MLMPFLRHLAQRVFGGLAAIRLTSVLLRYHVISEAGFSGMLLSEIEIQPGLPLQKMHYLDSP
jgi:hypothetical protein